MHWLKGVVVATAAMLLLTACFRSEMIIKVAADGSVVTESLVSLDPDRAVEELERSRGEPIPTDSINILCNELQSAAAETLPSPDIRFGDSVNEPYRDGDFCGIRSTLAISSSADTAEAIGSLFKAGFDETRLEQTGENWEFAVPFDLSRLADTDLAGLEIIDLEELDDLIEFKVSVELPGQAIDGQHNATSVDGGKFTWDINYQDPPTRLFAATQPSTGLGSGVFVIGGAIAAIALGLGAVGWFALGGKKKPAPSTKAPVGAVVAQQVAPEPYFDDATGIWVLDDPVRGRLWHHAGTGEWVPF